MQPARASLDGEIYKPLEHQIPLFASAHPIPFVGEADGLKKKTRADLKITPSLLFASSTASSDCQPETRDPNKHTFRTMPARLSTPLLSVDAAKIHKVDTTNAQSLRGMWTGESPESLGEGGKRSTKGKEEANCALWRQCFPNARIT